MDHAPNGSMGTGAAGNGSNFDGDDSCWAVGARQATPVSSGRDGSANAANAPHHDSRPDRSGNVDVVNSVNGSMPMTAGSFTPWAPRTLEEAGLSARQVEALCLKFLLSRGVVAGRQIAEQVALPFALLEKLFHQWKVEQLVVFKQSASLGDYLYELTELGVQRARRYLRQSSYFGAAPVSLDDYSASVAAQSVQNQRPDHNRLRQTFADLILDDATLGQIGEAITAGLGFFLFGAPGNGKTSIAERVTAVFGTTIWIPRSINAWGEVIRFYDPSVHEAIEEEAETLSLDRRAIDKRWVRIRRPTIVAGGELTLDRLEVTTNKTTGISEAPLQLKSNCGTFVMDDFGRQRFRPEEFLNRWIVPMEKRCDYLNMKSGRTFQVPIDQLVVLSTNMNPRDLLDEAFLRRIPYKIDVHSPTESQFHEAFQRVAKQFGIPYHPAAVDYLLQHHYKRADRALRFCHARDLLMQVRTAALFRNQRPELTKEALDAAVKNYFSVI